MVGNVVLTGGGSLFEGMPERITSELSSSLPSAFKASPDPDRFPDRAKV
ncbi:unnamed protein product [Ectocarpus sp. CCAP 1310/34]|nr:unnamed protein product [Ectocarpus sp. CCAP 1310/34]